MSAVPSSPSDYPVGELLGKLPEKARQWVLSHGLEGKSCEELHALLIQGRQELGLPPWSYLTPIYQCYAVSSVQGTKKALEGDTSWCICRGILRPLSLYDHNFGEAREVWVKLKSGDTVSAGWLITKMDGKDVFAFWTYRTERLILDCTRTGTRFANPKTGEFILSGYVLSKWRDYLQLNDTILVPEMRHNGKRKPKVKPPVVEEEHKVRVRLKQPIEVLPRAKPRWIPKRLQLLKLIQTVMTPEMMSASATDAGKKESYIDLCGLLGSSFDSYVKLLETSEIVEDRIPSDIILSCRSLLHLYVGNQGIHDAVQFWLTELIETDETRKD